MASGSKLKPVRGRISVIIKLTGSESPHLTAHPYVTPSLVNSVTLKAFDTRVGSLTPVASPLYSIVTPSLPTTKADGSNLVSVSVSVNSISLV